MQRATLGNPAEFLDRHQAIVCKISRSFASDPSDYDDLSQEICIGLWAAMDRIPPNVRESTYVYRVALNQAISWRRKRNSYARYLLQFWRDRSREPSAAPPIEKDSHLDLLYASIRELSEADRAIVVLYLDGMNALKMSEILGVTPETARKRVSRVKRKLSKIILNLERERDC